MSDYTFDIEDIPDDEHTEALHKTLVDGAELASHCDSKSVAGDSSVSTEITSERLEETEVLGWGRHGVPAAKDMTSGMNRYTVARMDRTYRKLARYDPLECSDAKKIYVGPQMVAWIDCNRSIAGETCDVCKLAVEFPKLVCVNRQRLLLCTACADKPRLKRKLDAGIATMYELAAATPCARGHSRKAKDAVDTGELFKESETNNVCKAMTPCEPLNPRKEGSPCKVDELGDPYMMDESRKVGELCKADEQCKADEPYKTGEPCKPCKAGGAGESSIVSEAEDITGANSARDLGSSSKSTSSASGSTSSGSSMGGVSENDVKIIAAMDPNTGGQPSVARLRADGDRAKYATSSPSSMAHSSDRRESVVLAYIPHEVLQKDPAILCLVVRKSACPSQIWTALISGRCAGLPLTPSANDAWPIDMEAVRSYITEKAFPARTNSGHLREADIIADGIHFVDTAKYDVAAVLFLRR